MSTSRFRRLLREPSSTLTFRGAVTLWVLKTTIDRWNFGEILQHLPRLLDREFPWIIFFPDPHTSVMLVQSHFCNWPTTFREKKWFSVSLRLPKCRCLPAAWSCLVRMRIIGSTIFWRGAINLTSLVPRLMHALKWLLCAWIPVVEALLFFLLWLAPACCAVCMWHAWFSCLLQCAHPYTKMLWPIVKNLWMNSKTEIFPRVEWRRKSIFFSRKVVGQ